MNSNFDIEKYKRTGEGIIKWSKTYIGTLVYPTGFGKTIAGVLAIRYLEHENIISTFSESATIILVSNDKSRQQWLKELNNFPIQTQIYIITPNELINISTNESKFKCDLLIVDEPQKFGTELRQQMLDHTLIDYIYSLHLTATPPDIKTEFGRFHKLNFPIVDLITPEEAESKGWICKSIEVCIPVVLTQEEQVKYEQCSEYIKETLSIFDNSIDWITNCRGGKKEFIDGTWQHISPSRYRELFAAQKGWNRDNDLSIPYFNDLDNVYNPTKLFERILDYDTIVRKRMVIVGNAKNKIDLTIKLLKELQNEKIIIFSQYIGIAEEIKNRANTEISSNFCMCYHSKLETQFIQKGTKTVKVGLIKQKRIAIDSITNDIIKALSTVGAMDDSVNIPKLSVGIITSGSTNPNQQTQRKGRELRIDDDKDIAYLINIFVSNTVDEYKLKARLKGQSIIMTNFDEFFEKYYKN